MVNSERHFPDVVIARNVIRLREERGWSQDDLAEKYGCTFQYISQLESGSRGFGKRTLPKLAKAFGVDQKELLEMPKDLASKEIGELWNKFTKIATGDNLNLFDRVLNILENADAGALKTIEGIISIIEKQRENSP